MWRCLHTLQRLADKSSKSVFSSGIRPQGLLVALLDSDAWRTNLFLVRGLVHRGISMQRNFTGTSSAQITSFYLISETCSQGEMWLNMVECICPLSLDGLW